MKVLHLGSKVAQVPVIQGGMGVGISRSSLAGAVAAQGGVGIISTAQIGYDEEGFAADQQGCNQRAIVKHIKKAKEIAGGKGLVGVNVMVALKHYREHVRTAAEAGADVIICGAGLPADLPALIAHIPEEKKPAIAPIVSSAKAATLILKMWDRHYQRTADFIVIEGPMAGGHLGFSLDQLQMYGGANGSEIADVDAANYDKEIVAIIDAIKPFEEKYEKKISVIVAGGIFDAKDIAHALELGADGVQIASRFVATNECDAAESYKEAYINAKAEDVRIVKSPVGMPGRALNNAFIQELDVAPKKVKRCYNCLEKCNPAEVPYCITEALTRAVEGDIDNGLIFCGANVGRINEMVTVEALMKELTNF